MAATHDSTSTTKSVQDDLVSRVIEVLGQILPASTLESFSTQISQVVDRVLAPFQILRRDDFAGYVAQLERLEQEVERLQEQVAVLQGNTQQDNDKE